MNDAVNKMLAKYQCQSEDDYEHALKEILQEITLCGLSDTDFFDFAAFYGGTALRILYGLPRFSEDMDFTLIQQEENFDWTPYLASMRERLEIYGFKIDVAIKNKSRNSAVESAFLKVNTLEALINIDQIGSGSAHRKLKIRLELDTAPPQFIKTEFEPVLQPTIFSVRVPVRSYLFAGKMHAVLCRNWKNKTGNRAKGRDWYDLIWYLKEEVPLNLQELEARMKQTGHLATGETLDQKLFCHLYEEVCSNLNTDAAKEDVLPFLEDSSDLGFWNPDFFKALSRKIHFENNE